jgi:hypothetical protein
MNRIIFFAAILTLTIFAGAANARIATGGAFTLQQSVTVNGSEKSAGGAFTIENTPGQAVAGQTATGGSFAVHVGFWTPPTVAPTAGNVTVGGRVLTADGGGIRNAQVTLTNSRGEIRTVMTGTFGYYRFSEVEANATYTVSVASKRFVFGNSAQVINVSDELY